MTNSSQFVYLSLSFECTIYSLVFFYNKSINSIFSYFFSCQANKALYERRYHRDWLRRSAQRAAVAIVRRRRAARENLPCKAPEPAPTRQKTPPASRNASCLDAGMRLLDPRGENMSCLALHFFTK